MSGVSRFVPLAMKQWWRRVGGVDMGDLRSMEPMSRVMGLDRGQPVCRWYIERFLAEQSLLIGGRVLEVADDHYTKQFGGDRVRESAVLHAEPGNPRATIVGNLETGAGIADGRFDTVILTQVLQCVFDVGAAARTIHRMLAAGGTALITVPAIAPISRFDADRWGEYWHFTEQSVQRLFEPLFGERGTRVAAFGNAVSAHAYLAGMASQELKPDELQLLDRDYPVVVTAVLSKA